MVFDFAPGVGLAGLVTFAVLAVWRGWLVPRRTVDELARATDRVEAVQAQRLSDSVTRESEWKAAWMAEKARADLQADQLGDLMELAKTTDAFIRELRQVARERQ